MKFAMMPLMVLGLVAVMPAVAQGVPPGLDGPRSDDLPLTRRERDFGLDGTPRELREQPGPDDEDYTTEEPDENLDDETLPPTTPLKPRRL